MKEKDSGRGAFLIIIIIVESTFNSNRALSVFIVVLPKAPEFLFRTEVRGYSKP